MCEKNIKLLSEAKEKKPNEITACLLKRPRHDHIIKCLHKLDVKIKYITDGDVWSYFCNRPDKQY